MCASFSFWGYSKGGQRILVKVLIIRIVSSERRYTIPSLLYDGERQRPLMEILLSTAIIIKRTYRCAVEVDFIEYLVAIEVKSGYRSDNQGLHLFKEQFHPKQTLIIGTNGLPLETFLTISPEQLF